MTCCKAVAAKLGDANPSQSVKTSSRNGDKLRLQGPLLESGAPDREEESILQHVASISFGRKHLATYGQEVLHLERPSFTRTLVVLSVSEIMFDRPNPLST